MKTDNRNPLEPFCSRFCLFASVGGLVLLLGACSSGGNTSKPPPASVETAMPVRQTFHTKVSAFGQLAADSRKALTLSLPKAGQIVATRVIAGQSVKRGEPLLKFATAPAARTAYLQAQNAVTIARESLQQTERLRAGKLATNAQLYAARKALADAQTALAAQAKLGGAQAVTNLKAPADGVVTALLVQQGQQVPAGAQLIQFSPRAALAAQLGVDPDSAAGIRTGMSAKIQPVYNSHGTPPLAATVAMVGDAVNPKSQLVDVVATLDGHHRLPAGTALSATIDTSRFTAWAVPRNALQSDAKGEYLFQIEQGKAHRVKVKVLAPDGSPVGVEGALDPNAPVITLGSYEISDGDAVKAEKAGGTTP